MNITAKTDVKLDTFPRGTLVNKLGEYLYKELDSAYKFNKSSNLYEVYLEAYYQVPHYGDHPQDKIKYDDEIKELETLSNAKRTVDKLIKDSLTKYFKDYEFIF